MLQDIIQDFARRMESRILEITIEFALRLDFSGLEEAINEECAALCAELQQAILEALLTEAFFLSLLKVYGGKRGMRFKGYRKITVTLSCGRRIKVMSPYFIKAWPHGRRKKRGPNGAGAHLALDVSGFIGHVSPGLLSDAVQMALLCPSYEAARTVLAGRGINPDVKALRRLCRQAGNPDRNLRGRIALSGQENLRGCTSVISADGGRLRERRRKRGRKAKNLKRQGYHTEWHEP